MGVKIVNFVVQTNQYVMKRASAGHIFECYIWFVNTIAQGPISRADIDGKWAHASVNDYKTDSIPESTFHRWRNSVELMFDISIKCNSLGQYYIEDAANLPHAELRSRMFNLFSVNNLLRDCKELGKNILFEPAPAGEEYLTTIIEAMRDKFVLQITYKNFTQTAPVTYFVEPYCLKMYRQRWYLIAFARNRNAIRHFALDRIQIVGSVKVPYEMPADFDGEAYFHDVCGVTVLNDKLEQITVSVGAQQVPYIRTLPLHPSQIEIETHDTHSVFSYTLIPNEEFYRELRACGRDVLVLSPDWLCQEFRADAKLLYNMYKEISPE